MWSHTHVTYYWDRAPRTTPLRQGRRRTPEETADVAAENARRTLESGVTTIRDLGASGGADILMRDRVTSGALIGPRMFVAGRGLSAGRGSGLAPEALRAEVDARVKSGSDWIKVYASRGSFDSVDTTQTLTFEQMKAIVEAAHAAGKKVAIHSYGASGVKDAVRAGADSASWLHRRPRRGGRGSAKGHWSARHRRALGDEGRRNRRRTGEVGVQRGCRCDQL